MIRRAQFVFLIRPPSLSPTRRTNPSADSTQLSTSTARRRWPRPTPVRDSSSASRTSWDGTARPWTSVIAASWERGPSPRTRSGGCGITRWNRWIRYTKPNARTRTLSRFENVSFFRSRGVKCATFFCSVSGKCVVSLSKEMRSKSRCSKNRKEIYCLDF